MYQNDEKGFHWSWESKKEKDTLHEKEMSGFTVLQYRLVSPMIPSCKTGFGEYGDSGSSVTYRAGFGK